LSNPVADVIRECDRTVDAPDADAARRREIAARVEYWMRRRGLTRRIFADRMGKSVSWVDKVKSGDRQLDRLSVLDQIADVLGISLRTLIDVDEARRVSQCADEVEILQLRAALQRYDGLCGDTGQCQPDLARLRREVHYGWLSFQSSNYQIVTRMLPDLLVSLQQAYRALDGRPRSTAAELLVQAYWLAAEVSFKYGRMELGWIAGDRGIAVAEWTGDLTLIGATTRRLVHALMSVADTASRQRAVTLVRTTAARLEPGIGTASPAYLSAYGSLFLKGSIAATRLGDAGQSRDLNAEAATVARLLGGDRNEHWSAFGPTNVAIHRVAALAELHEGGRAVEYAQRLTDEQLSSLPRERRANHILDVARGYNQWGKRDEAVTLVLEADSMAREEVRCRPLTHALVTELVRGHPRGTTPSVPLARLAREIGIQV
jgi:transcriptional regulator with XRE-family HTH domain